MSGSASTAFEWDEILNSRPELASDVNIYPHVYRDVDWYLLVNELTNTRLLLDQHSYDLVRRFDGKLTVNEALDLNVKASEQADVVLLFSSMIEHKMLSADLVYNNSSVESVPLEKAGASIRSVFSIKVPLLDPHNFFERLGFLTRWCFSSWANGLYALLTGVAVLLCINRWPELSIHWDSRFQDPSNLVWFVLLYPLIKVLHEIGHGLAAKRWGADVREMGIMLLVFIPVPYVDASATASFYSARHRMAVAAAGVVTESVLASLAILGWFYTEPGFVNDILFNIAVIGGASTLLFNGNPLLRFDGYYVLSDWLQIPNLGPRASGYLRYLFRSYGLGLESYRPPMARGEAGWLLLYGVASGLYRLLIGFVIALYVASRFFIFGLLLAIWYLLFHMFRPLMLSVIGTLPAARAEGKLIRFSVVMAMIFLITPLMLFTVPVSQSTVAPGVIIPPRESQLRAASAGFLADILKSNGEQLEKGEVVYRLRSEELKFEQKRLLGLRDELDAQFRRSLVTNVLDAEKFKAERQSVEVQLKEIEQDIDNLLVRSESSGKLSTLPISEKTGSYFDKGAMLGYVVQADDWSVRVMVSQVDIERVLTDTLSSQALRYSDPFRAIEAKIEAETPQAVGYLPAKSLGTLGGGFLTVDARDQEGKKLVIPMFEVAVSLPDTEYFVGETVLVRFIHSDEPLGARFVLWLRRLLSAELGL